MSKMRERLITNLSNALSEKKDNISKNQAMISQLENEIELLKSISPDAWEIWESCHGFNPDGMFSMLDFIQALRNIDTKLHAVEFKGKLNGITEEK